MPWHTFGKQPEEGKNDDRDNDRGNNGFSVLCSDEYNSGYSGERMSRVPRIQEVITGARYRRTEPESQQSDASVITDSHLL